MCRNSLLLIRELNMRAKISDRSRLVMSFTLIIVLFAISGSVTLYGLFALGSLTETIYLHPLVVSNASLQAAVRINRMHRDMKNVVLSETSSEREAALERVRQDEVEVYQQLDLIRDNILGNAGKELERETRLLVDEYKPIREDVRRFMEKGDSVTAIHITQHRGARHVVELDSKMAELSRYARTKATGFRQKARNSQVLLERVTIGIIAAAILFSVLITVVATRRVTFVHATLRNQKAELETALAEIKTLRGIIPVCANCRQIRDDAGVWQALEEYLDAHSDASVTHGICPECMAELYPEIADEVTSRLAEKGQVQRGGRPG